MKELNLLFLAGLLSGCSFLTQHEPLPLYTLKGESLNPRNAFSELLAIDIPISEASLNTSRIALTPSPFQRDYLADGEWPDRLPRVFQEILVESLGQRWGESHVDRAAGGLGARYILRSEIQDFSAYHFERERPEIHLKITFKVINLPDRNIVAARTFFETTPALSATMKEIVIAFNKGVHCLLKKTIPWLEESLLKKKGF